MKKFLFLATLVFTALSFPGMAYAESVWVFHLDLSQGRLAVDPSVSQSVTEEDDPNFSIVEFSRQQPVGNYDLVLYDVSGARAVETRFEAKDGKFTVKIPYFSIVDKFEIYSRTDNALALSGSLNQFVKCNDNGICELEKGENLNTCLPDCASGHVKYSQETQQKLDENHGVIIDPATGEAILRDLRSVQVENNVDNSPTDQGVQPESGQSVFSSLGLSKQWVAIGFLVFLGLGAVFGIFYAWAKRRNRKLGL